MRDDVSNEALVPNGREFTITGVHADHPTRTTVNDGVTVAYWEVGDEIKV